MQKLGMFFPCILLLGARFSLTHRLLRSISQVRAVLTVSVLGLLFSPCFAGHGAQIRSGPLWISNPLIEISSVHAWSCIFLVRDCINFPSVTWKDCVCCGLWISNLWAEFPCLGPWIAVFHLWCVCGCGSTLVWVAAELFWPR